MEIETENDDRRMRFTASEEYRLAAIIDRYYRFSAEIYFALGIATQYRKAAPDFWGLQRPLELKRSHYQDLIDAWNF